MKTVAIYPGSFNPFHKGHLNIFEKAEKIFGEGNVIIAIGHNPQKSYTEDKSCLNALDIRNRILEKTGKIVTVEVYESFLHEFIQKWEDFGYNVVIIRGLRNGSDLDYEVNQMRFVSDFKENINVVYITCDKEYEHISSSAIRSLQQFRSGSGDSYLI